MIEDLIRRARICGVVLAVRGQYRIEVIQAIAQMAMMPVYHIRNPPKNRDLSLEGCLELAKKMVPKLGCIAVFDDVEGAYRTRTGNPFEIRLSIVQLILDFLRNFTGMAIFSIADDMILDERIEAKICASFQATYNPDTSSARSRKALWKAELCKRRLFSDLGDEADQYLDKLAEYEFSYEVILTLASTVIPGEEAMPKTEWESLLCLAKRKAENVQIHLGASELDIVEGTGDTKLLDYLVSARAHLESGSEADEDSEDDRDSELGLGTLFGG